MTEQRQEFGSGSSISLMRQTSNLSLELMDQVNSSLQETFLARLGSFTKNETKFHCAICLDDIAIEHRVQLPCGHCMCRYCALSHVACNLKVKRLPKCCHILEEAESQQGHHRAIGYPCAIEISEAFIINHNLAAKEDLDKYHRQLRLTDPATGECPHCQSLVTQTQLDLESQKPLPDMICSNCFEPFCLLHSNQHINMTCAKFLEMNRNNPNDKKSQEEIDRTSRACPNCFVPITKNGGCNKMTCTQCHKHFCWLCNQEVDEQLRPLHFLNGECQQFDKRQDPVITENVPWYQNIYRALDTFGQWVCFVLGMIVGGPIGVVVGLLFYVLGDYANHRPWKVVIWSFFEKGTATITVSLWIIFAFTFWIVIGAIWLSYTILRVIFCCPIVCIRVCCCET